jgi:N-acetylmuramic acid 6-phosphate etherase
VNIPRRAATENVHGLADRLDGATTLELLRAMNMNDSLVPEAVGSRIDAIATVVEEVTSRLRSGGRLHYFGAGTSGRLATLDAAECPPTFGVAPDLVQAHMAGGRDAGTQAVEAAEDSTEDGRAECRAAVRRGDAVVGIAASGETPYVRGAVGAARDAGVFTAAVVCAPASSLAAEVDVAIEVMVGPEILAGSTRLMAGTAQKLVLNMLSTAVFWRLGHVYRGRMVDVVPSNGKLRRRAAEMVADLTGRDLESAAAALEQAGGAKLAVLMLRAGLDRDAAAARLDAVHGDLTRALESTS